MTFKTPRGFARQQRRFTNRVAKEAFTFGCDPTIRLPNERGAHHITDEMPFVLSITSVPAGVMEYLLDTELLFRTREDAEAYVRPWKEEGLDIWYTIYDSRIPWYKRL